MKLIEHFDRVFMGPFLPDALGVFVRTVHRIQQKASCLSSDASAMPISSLISYHLSISRSTSAPLALSSSQSQAHVLRLSLFLTLIPPVAHSLLSAQFADPPNLLSFLFEPLRRLFYISSLFFYFHIFWIY
jgi:hypothetical protein